MQLRLQRNANVLSAQQTAVLVFVECWRCERGVEAEVPESGWAESVGGLGAKFGVALHHS